MIPLVIFEVRTWDLSNIAKEVRDIFISRYFIVRSPCGGFVSKPWGYRAIQPVAAYTALDSE